MEALKYGRPVFVRDFLKNNEDLSEVCSGLFCDVVVVVIVHGNGDLLRCSVEGSLLAVSNKSSFGWLLIVLGASRVSRPSTKDRSHFCFFPHL